MKVVKKILTFGLSIAILGGSVITSDAYDKPNVNRIAGKDNYETAALIADKQTYSTAILVNLDNSIADGLSSSGLSGAVNAPILLTKKDNIPDVTMTRLNKAKKIYIIGGVNSVSPGVESNLKSKGIEVIRIQGADRIQTSLNVANEIKKYNNSKYVFFTNGFKGEADAISIAPIAARYKAPIIQTNGKNTLYKISEKERYTIGGTTTMNESIVKLTGSFRIGGKDRYETNSFINDGIYDKNGEGSFYGFNHEWEAGMPAREGITYVCDGYNLVSGLVCAPLAKWEEFYLVTKGANTHALENAKISILGNLDKSLEDRLIKTDPLIEDLIGRWTLGDDYIDVGEFTFTDSRMDTYRANYDILDIITDDKLDFVKAQINKGNKKQIVVFGFDKNKHSQIFVGYYNTKTGKIDNLQTFNSWISFNEAEQIAIDACLDSYKNYITRKDIVSINFLRMESDLIGVGEPTYLFELKIKYYGRISTKYVNVNQRTGEVYGVGLMYPL